MILLPLLLAAAAADPAPLTHTAIETEMFAIPISPNLFNWTYQGMYVPRVPTYLNFK